MLRHQYNIDLSLSLIYITYALVANKQLLKFRISHNIVSNSISYLTFAHTTYPKRREYFFNAILMLKVEYSFAASFSSWQSLLKISTCPWVQQCAAIIDNGNPYTIKGLHVRKYKTQLISPCGIIGWLLMGALLRSFQTEITHGQNSDFIINTVFRSRIILGPWAGLCNQRLC